MPKPDLTPPTPDSCIGYGCVIVKGLDEYQGFFINDSPELQGQINRTIGLAVSTGAHPIGALQASVVEGVLTKNWPLVGVTALALSTLSKLNYWIILASKEPEGTRTEMKPLKATSVEEARAEIEALPEVMEIKDRLVEQLRQPKQ